MANIELVIFDMDGLIFDTERIYYKAWQEASKSHGYEMTWEVYTQIVARNSRYIEKTLKEIFGAELPYKAIEQMKRDLSNEMVRSEGIQIKKGLLELLDALETKGIKKAVATSSQREKALNYLEMAGIKERFDDIICGDEVMESKPNPEIFVKVGSRLGADPAHTLVLEDSRLGLEAGKKGDMKTVCIPDLVTPDEEMKRNADHILESLDQVITLLD
ncbi:HAD family hydrolase [Cellulosilyticum ruminicola]|uniref:HAD family hydrolase n=1 Tax=Cellulosilyticum ruminicola TaxID=425254 RepID=UPI0006CF2BAA|nr:HAD family phosphatase [Cellulosilyticum ruminicola]